MKSLIMIGGLVAGAAFFPQIASAASQTGGLPEVSARVTVVETLVATLNANVAALQTLVNGLQSNVTTLQGANDNLKAALAAEQAARAAADTALQAALGAETATRKQQDLEIFNLLLNEADARVDGDNGLMDLIKASAGKAYAAPAIATFLPNGDETVLARLNLPPGNYFLTGKTSLNNFVTSASWVCSLYLNGQALLDQSKTTTQNGYFSNGYQDVLGMQRLVTLSDATSEVTMQCHTGEPHSDVSGVQLTAIQVGTVIQQ